MAFRGKRGRDIDRFLRREEKMRVNSSPPDKDRVLKDLYKQGVLEGSSEKKYTRAAGLATGGAVGIAGSLASHYLGVGRMAANTYETTKEIRNLASALKSVVVKENSQQLQEIIKNSPSDSTLQKEYQRYLSNVNSRARALQEASQSYDAVARISASTPGYETKFVQSLTEMRNKLLQGAATATQGKEAAGIRNSQDYERNWGKLIDLTGKALAEKNIDRGELKELVAKIGKNLKDAGAATDRELRLIEKQMQEVNKYSELIGKAKQLTPREIQGATDAYKSVMETARGYGLKEGRPYSSTAIEYGTDITAGIMLGAYAARFGAYFGKIAHKVRDIATGGKAKRENRAIDQAKSGLESTLKVFLLFFSFIALSFGGMVITGNTIAENSRGSFIGGVIFAVIIISIYFIIRKTYKHRKQ